MLPNHSFLEQDFKPVVLESRTRGKSKQTDGGK